MTNKVVLTALLALSSASTAVATPPGPPGHKIKICHATASNTNPYVIVEIDEAAWSETPGVDSQGRAIRRSNHWHHQASLGGRGDFWLADETMTCAEYAHWLQSSSMPQSYSSAGRAVWVSCSSREAPDGSRIPGITNFIDDNTGQIISVPCPDWHGALLAPASRVQTTAARVDYYVTNATGNFPEGYYFHSKFNPTPGVATAIALDAAGGNFAVVCPAGGALDIQEYRYNFFGQVQATVVETDCTAGQPLMKHPTFDYGSSFAPIALCPDSGQLSVCYTGNSGFASDPSGLTTGHACFDSYSCVPGQPVDFTKIQVLNSGFNEFPTNYEP